MTRNSHGSPSTSSGPRPATSPDQERARRESEQIYADIAADYDRHLLKDCAYRSPARVARALVRWAPQLWFRASPRAPDGAGTSTGDRLPHPAHGSSHTTPLWLDIGAGTGLLGTTCREHGLDVKWVALDLSQAMLRVLDGRSYLHRVRADAVEHLPFRADSFGGAAAVGLMEHVVDPAPIFRSLRRILRPGALFAFTFCLGRQSCSAGMASELDFMCHDAARVHAELVAAGFSVLDQGDAHAYLNGPDGWVDHRLVISRAPSP